MLCLVVSATFGQTLGNGKIKAEFGKYGLKSVHDLILDRSVMFGEDHWSITINDKSIKSAELKPSKISKGKNSLSYYYQAHPFAVEVAYELKPGWRFVSKQLIVSNLKGGDYHIDRVEVFRGILDTPIADEHVIRTAREVFRKHHELRDFGAFVRFNPSWGAFFLVQNPFMEWQSDGGAYSIGYGLDMPWKHDYGPFKSDRGCIGTYKLAGRRSPPYMDSHPKWIM